MKRMRLIIGSLFAVLVCAVSGTARAENLAITSFGGTGQLTYSTLNDGTNYKYMYCKDAFGALAPEAYYVTGYFSTADSYKSRRRTSKFCSMGVSHPRHAVILSKASQ